ncbi:MAG: hypothetical protein IK057_06545 [Clostridia bacterium]|nr:hypothetical protein [Clostridia bacterium]
MLVGFYGRTYANDAKIPLESFPLWEKRAVAEINRITNDDILKISDENSKMCICEVAELLYETAKSEGILSENNDGYSVRFDKGDRDGKIYDIASKWLSKSGLLYRGDVL